MDSNIHTIHEQFIQLLNKRKVSDPIYASINIIRDNDILIFKKKNLAIMTIKVNNLIFGTSDEFAKYKTNILNKLRKVLQNNNNKLCTNLNININTEILQEKPGIKFKENIITIIPVLNRHHILSLTIKSLKKQTVATDILLLISLESDRKFAEINNLAYIFVKNKPLSNKHQKGIEYVRKTSRANNIVVVGSDDIFVENWLERCINKMNRYDHDVIGSDAHYIYDIHEKKLYYRSYNQETCKNFLIKPLFNKYALGSGRIIRRKILNKINWQLYPVNKNSGLDTESYKQLAKTTHKFGLIRSTFFVSFYDKANVITTIDKIRSNGYNHLRLLDDLKTYPNICSLIEKYPISINYQTMFNDLGIYQVYISSPLEHFRENIEKAYNLHKYIDVEKPVLFFGLYKDEDIEIIKNHCHETKYLLWGGTDADLQYNTGPKKKRIDEIKKIENLIHISSSSNLKERLENLKIPNINMTISFCEHSEYFRPTQSITAKKIYIYNGRYPGQEEKYGKQEYSQIVKRLPEYEYIYSNNLDLPHDQMADIYADCFIGLRLTKNDGNANTVLEMRKMDIPVIHNGDYDNCIKWDTVDDIELEIRYRNIDIFSGVIEEYTNILFVCTDYPGWGGAATNTLDLIKFYSGHKTFGIFIHKDKIEDHDFGDNILINDSYNNIGESFDKCKNYFGSNPTLIILRNFCDLDIINSYFNCPKYFLIPGLFRQSLDKPVALIETLEELQKYVHPKILTTICGSDKVFSNSYLTYNILRKFYSIETEIFYFNYVPFYKRKLDKDKNWENREYYFGAIVSDFTRIIKNKDQMLEIFSNNLDKKKIVIGKNSDMFSHIAGMVCLDLSSHDVVLNYLQKIKYIVSTSHYESCSNVIVEGLYHGCKLYDWEKIVLITSTQYPRYGGAATCAYELHKYLIGKGIKSICLFFHNKKVNYNPENCPNVFLSKFIDYGKKSSNGTDMELYKVAKESIIKCYNGAPIDIYSFNYLAPIISKEIFPCSTVYYMVTGCKYINNNNLMTAESMLHSSDLQIIDKCENYCMNISDYVVPNSYLSENLIRKFYPKCSHKILDFIDFHEIFNISKNQNTGGEVKEYDICFICSDFRREVKNINLVSYIYENPKLSGYKKVCIGKNSVLRIPEKENNILFDLISKERLNEVLAKTKVVIIPSIIETYSITSIEAYLNGCITIYSKNVGSAYNVNNFFVMDNYDSEEWSSKLGLILENYSYFKKIFYNNYESTSQIIPSLINSSISRDIGIKNILFATVDIPYVGGAATNTYHILRHLQKYKNINTLGIFISKEKGDYNPDNLDNIYKFELDEKISSNIKEKKEELENIYGPIHAIFCKNYKVCIIMRYVFPHITIIFSPSGLRCLTGKNDFYYNLEMEEELKFRSTCTTNLEDVNNIHKFILKNDIGLDSYSLDCSDYIVPNSALTYSIISNTLTGTNKEKLFLPIYLTNINYSNNYNNAISYQNREIDIIFVAYSWKRTCKNYNLVTRLAQDPALKGYNIYIIGKNQGKEELGPNTVRLDYIDNKELQQYFSKSKVLVIPGFYDSNPNVLIEAITQGCNVVTSKNVGNSENLSTKSIVENYNDCDAWVKVVLNNLKEFNGYNGPTSLEIEADLVNLLYNATQKLGHRDSYKNKNQLYSVGVYKVIADWNNATVTSHYKLEVGYQFMYEKRYDLDFIRDIIYYDIYFKLYLELSVRKKYRNHNYIIIDQNIETNEYYNVFEHYAFYPYGLRIWKIKDLPSLLHFNKGGLYFVRGVYTNVFKLLIPKTSQSINYPATSLSYTYSWEQGVLSAKPKQIKTYPFTAVLVHEDENYKTIYDGSKCIQFNKFVSDKFIFKNYDRIFDLCYVATSTQRTKNHHLFFEFLKYCDIVGKKYNVVYVGNLEEIEGLTRNENFISKLNNIMLSNIPFCTKEQLIELFNKCKINILFSGRDAYPRVICESAACGCFNIALDTISGGQSFYNGQLGVLIGSDKVDKKSTKSGSITYVPSSILWDQMIPYIDQQDSYGHVEISAIFKEKYSLMGVTKSIMREIG